MRRNQMTEAVQPRADEVAALAEQVLSIAGSGKLTDEARTRLQSELTKRGFTSIRAYSGSLVEDPAQPGTYYMAVDAVGGNTVQPMLLLFRSGPVATSGRFANPLLA